MRLTRLWKFGEEQLHVALALLIGALVGLVVVGFILITEHLGSRLYPPEGSSWRRILFPVIGSLFTGILLARYFPAARGSGIPQTRMAMLLEGGIIRLRTVLGRLLCSSVSLACGIALGREGPSVQIGGGVASIIGRDIGLTPGGLRALIPVGAAAAVSAAFNTPIAGVLFALEEIVGDLHAEVLGSAVIASGTAWVVLHLFLGNEPLFHVPEYQLVSSVEFLIYAVLGIFGGLVSVAFVKLTLLMRSRFLLLPERTRWAQPLTGGVITGILALWTPQVLGVGYDYVGQVLNGDITVAILLSLLVMKLVASATCYASGNSGGIFGPSLFFGAMLGGVVGTIAQRTLPGWTASPGAYALVGMGAVFAGIIRVPMTSVFMIFELTRDYAIVVPLMIANMVSYVISRRLQEVPVYEALALQDGIHFPRPARERSSERGPFVYDVWLRDVPVVNQDTALNEIQKNAPAIVVIRTGVHEHAAPGEYPAAILRQRLTELADKRGEQACVADLLRVGFNYPHVHPDQALEDALDRMEEANLDALAVLDRADTRRVLGVVTLDSARQAFRPRLQRGLESHEYRAII